MKSTKGTAYIQLEKNRSNKYESIQFQLQLSRSFHKGQIFNTFIPFKAHNDIQSHYDKAHAKWELQIWTMNVQNAAKTSLKQDQTATSTPFPLEVDTNAASKAPNMRSTSALIPAQLSGIQAKP